MPDLLAAGVLQAGELLIARHRGRELRTELLNDGRARGIDRNPDKSVSMVAKDAIGRNVNGWDFWSVERDGTLVRLERIRANFLQSRRQDTPSDPHPQSQ